MKKILILDDEPLIIDSLSTLFKRFHFDVVGAMDPEESIRLAQGFRPDLLLIDWTLAKGFSCVDVINAIEKNNSDLKVIIMSGYPYSKISTELNGKKVSAICEKPVDFKELHILVKELTCDAA